LRAKRAEAGEVHVERTHADDVAPRWRAAGLTEAREQGPHHQERGTQRSHLVGVGDRLGQGARLDVHHPALSVEFDGRAEVTQDRRKGIDVHDIGDVA
jgi:hypothetical protein